MNPYKTDKFKPTLTLAEVQELVNNASDTRTLSGAVGMVTFAGKSPVRTQVFRAGFVPGFILNNMHPDFFKGIMLEYQYGGEPRTTGFLVDKDGTYLFDDYTDDDLFFDKPEEPFLIVIDHYRKAFMLQYPSENCVFGDETGKLRSLRMD